MKKLTLVSAAIIMSGLVYQTANAQIRVHFNINLGPRPVVVAPAPVYDANFYYLPEVEAYYSVGQQRYFYQDGDTWVSAAYLPGRYHDYDWQHARHFAVNEPRPYMHNDAYRARYGGFDGHRDWNFRDDHSRVYADRERFDNRLRGNDNQFRGNDNRRDYQRNDDRGARNDNRNDHQQQPQQNNNQNSNQNPRGNDNNRGDHDNRTGRSGRF